MFVTNDYNKFNNRLEECPLLLPLENNAIVVKMCLRGYWLTFLRVEVVKYISYASCVDLDQATTAKTENHVGMQQMVAEDECSVDEPIPKAKESRKDTEFPCHHLPQRMKSNAPLFRRKSQLVQQKKVVLPRKRSLGIATGANDDNTFPSFDDYL